MSEQHTGSVRVTDQPDRNRFEIAVDGQVAGFAEYRRRPGEVVFTHTEIAEAYQGQRLASRLAREALEAVRAEGAQVTPLCPYIVDYIRKHPDYLELVDEAHRDELASPPSS